MEDSRQYIPFWDYNFVFISLDGVCFCTKTGVRLRGWLRLVIPLTTEPGSDAQMEQKPMLQTGCH